VTSRSAGTERAALTGKYVLNRVRKSILAGPNQHIARSACVPSGQRPPFVTVAAIARASIVFPMPGALATTCNLPAAK